MTRQQNSAPFLTALHGGIIVSSQVMDPRSPLSDPHTLSLMAQAAELGGAAGFRVDGTAVLKDLRTTTDLPIIGIHKNHSAGTDTYITPSVNDALALIDAGADIVAAQATKGSRPAESFATIADAVHRRGRLVMADIATATEGAAAAADGADIIATTMAGYTRDTEGAARPAINLLEDLVREIAVPVIVEGGIWTTAHVRAAFESGAWAVVAGSAITAPDRITAHLATALPLKH